MKSFKLILIITIFSIGLSSFKNNVSQNLPIQYEYLTIAIMSGKLIVYSNGEEISKEKLAFDHLKHLSILFDKYGQEGWTLKSSVSPGLWSAWYFERIKQ